MFDSNKTLRVDGLSKLSKVEDLREKLVDFFEAPVEKQMLIFRGKQVRTTRHVMSIVL
jgi:E3 ubiquitin-protein ligase UHRF1